MSLVRSTTYRENSFFNAEKMRELCDSALREVTEIFSLGSYGSVGGACSVIEKRAKSDRTLRRRIEQLREIVSSTII